MIRRWSLGLRPAVLPCRRLQSRVDAGLAGMHHCGAESDMRPCIVIVEDEPMILQVLHDLFDVQGFATVGIGRPDLVLAATHGIEAQLFLIDIMLPRTSGIELAEQLRASGFNRTPMIAMSASNVMLNVAARSGIFQATVSKPFDFDTLFDYIEQLVPAETYRAI